MFRIYIERKKGFENEAKALYSQLNDFLGISALTGLRYFNRYDIENITEQEAKQAAQLVFSEPQSDIVSFTHPTLTHNDQVVLWEYVPGQYDQRADSATQCLLLLQANTAKRHNKNREKPIVRCAKMVVLSGNLSTDDIQKIQNYLVNPVDSQIASSELPKTLTPKLQKPEPVTELKNFISASDEELQNWFGKLSLAMDFADFAFMHNYFKKIGRNPTETEVRVLDTYWSDHCRHSTFNTVLDSIQVEKGPYADLIKKSLQNYQSMRTTVYQTTAKPITLMDMAVIGAKYLRKNGKLNDLEVSDEINACSIYIDVQCVYTKKDKSQKKKTEKWLLLFKNETHNHPTEIEPFGGAATCIGGAIRDPLSGRAWVYQALRVTGAADPTKSLAETRPGKLPQIKLTREAAAGFSSYGNQIGLTTGQVHEVYHPGFEAKRMELGAVIAAAPAENVVREEPEAGDVVILVGGGTGRDGIGGATGSSKVHTEESVATAGAEVQKGNAVEERKIQRLFRNKNVSTIIRRCNDFGAGGVAVAVGELAPGLEINLDAVPKKYEGLNGTELAISESQERMAVVVREKHIQEFIDAAVAENLHATVIARVTDSERLVMKWQNHVIVDIERSFLDTAGAKRHSAAIISSPTKKANPLCKPIAAVEAVFKSSQASLAKDQLQHAWKANLADLLCCSQRGLSERFDGSIGASTVLFPLGGTEQATPEVAMAAKIPVWNADKIKRQGLVDTQTASIMSFGYDPHIAQWSPWHGAQIAVLHSLANIAAAGGNPLKARLTFQEYFERTTTPQAWGKPAAALLGALDAQAALGTPSIGGKDSMSGSYQDISVPPTLVSFAVVTENTQNILSGAFKKPGKTVYLLAQKYTAKQVPVYSNFKANATVLRQLNQKKQVLSAYTVRAGGIAEGLSKMAFGNNIGFSLDAKAIEVLVSLYKSLNACGQNILFLPLYGSLIIETEEPLSAEFAAKSKLVLLGTTQTKPEVAVGETTLALDELRNISEKTLSQVFPPLSADFSSKSGNHEQACFELPDFAKKRHPSFAATFAKAPQVLNPEKAKPKVLLPVFPGTNCEYDMQRAFSLAGADTEILVFRNNTSEALSDSLKEMARKIKKCNILAFSGGFSAGDEPDGSGKFIANVLRQERIKDEVINLIKNNDGLILGICNGFQALIKTGLLPYGEILTPTETMPTLTFNTINRHISRIVQTRVVSAASPWAQDASILQSNTHILPISHGEGRIFIEEKFARTLFESGQVFSQYVSPDAQPTMLEPFNPNGSMYAIEGLTSPDGRILGKMAHNERTLGINFNGSENDLIKNIGGNRCQNIFAAGVSYFRSN